MKWFRGVFIIIVVASLTYGCATAGRVGISTYTGFQELPFPSNSYGSGQIVEVYSNPKAVEVTFDPKIPWDRKTTSDGWNISVEKQNLITLNLAAAIKDIVSADGQFGSDFKTVIRLTNTKTVMIEKAVIYEFLKNSIKGNPGMMSMLKDYMADGTQYYVITQTLSANISFSVVDSSGVTLNLDPKVLSKIGGSLNTTFSSKAGESTYMSGDNLIIGILYDPSMVDYIMKSLSPAHI